MRVCDKFLKYNNFRKMSDVIGGFGIAEALNAIKQVCKKIREEFKSFTHN